MDRRDFFTLTIKRFSDSGKSSQKFFAGLAPYTGSWTVNEVSHLLKRTMFGAKKAEDASIPFKTYPEWKWTHPTYVIESSRKLTDFKTVEIDPSQRMADIERKNNKMDITW